MKCIVMALLFFSSISLAKTSDLLKCLGAEEKKLHLKKDTGPIYELNQRLISEIILVPNAFIRTEDLMIICKRQTSESWKLLNLSLVKGKDLFQIPTSVVGAQKEMTEGMIEDFIESSKEILLSFIAQVQAKAPTPECLIEEIPQLANFFQDIKYLQEEIDINKIFENRDKKIFDQLKNYPQAFQRCRDRLKKKPKSGSTSPAKKR